MQGSMGCASSAGGGDNGKRRGNHIRINIIEPTTSYFDPTEYITHSRVSFSSGKISRSSNIKEQNETVVAEEVDKRCFDPTAEAEIYLDTSTGEGAKTITDIMENCDVMICYKPCDYELVEYLAESMRKENMCVWHVEPSVPADIAASQHGQAIFHCKVFMLVLSEQSAADRSLKDALALAYISNKAIMPVGCKYFRKIAAHMDSGMKLMLAKINWVFFVKQEEYDSSFENMVGSLKQELKYHGQAGMYDTEADDDSTVMNIHHANYSKEQSDILDEEDKENPDTAAIVDFWRRHFEESSEVSWIAFRDEFLKEYGEQITTEFDEEKKKLFVHLMYKDMFELRKSISHETYKKFAGKINGDPDHFYNRLKDYVVGSLAMREVFSMESSVRLTAIQNLGSFHTPAVVSALMDLLQDEDPNIRAVAALALAKTGQKSGNIVIKLIKLLSDEDRLVRESACLSLGHMRATDAVSHIADLWRNDSISHVRQAAEIALKKIGGDEAHAAIHVTKLLTSEMQNLGSVKKE